MAPTIVARPPQSVKVALTTDPTGHGGSPVVAQGVKKAADILANAGYVVEEVDPPSVVESTGIIQQISVMEMKSYLPEMMPIISREAKTFLETIAADTEPDLTTYMKAIAQRHKIAREWSVFMERYPLVLGPVSTLNPSKSVMIWPGRPSLMTSYGQSRLLKFVI